MAFAKNVFINCPFDDEYKSLFRPLIFTLLILDFEPKISQTRSSSNVRISQIKQHIKECKYGIHDLSRSKPMKRNELPRFNMPYELGLDIGCAEYGGRRFASKRILILETERYHYQKVISDIAGQDIENHNDDPATLVTKVRNWLSTIDTKYTYPSANEIWNVYGQFYDDITVELLAQGFTDDEIEKMPVSDFINFAKDWIGDFRS